MTTTADTDLDNPRVAQMEAAAKKIKQHKFNTPPIILAQSPDDKSTIISLKISHSLLEKLGRSGIIPKFMSLWYNILGIIPPVPNIGFFEDAAADNKATKLTDAHALLKGLDRPCKSNGNGEDVYRYILKPEYTYEYIAHQVCTARRIHAPCNTVLVVCVRLYDNHKKLDDSDIKGEIISWDWTKADNTAPNLPHSFNENHIIWRGIEC